MPTTESMHPSVSFRLGFFALAVAIGVLAGCANTSSLTRPDFKASEAGTNTVLLMPTDIEISALTAGGALEPSAAWTEAAKANVSKALADYFAVKGDELQEYSSPDEAERRRRDDQVSKLHEIVGGSILNHQYTGPFALPTKQGGFDWTLGEDAKALGDYQNAEYALFVFFRDSHATAGRVAAIVVAAALGVGLQGGAQVGFASLVDTRTGNIVWFNRLASGTGDLRTPGPAASAVKGLLVDLPL